MGREYSKDRRLGRGSMCRVLIVDSCLDHAMTSCPSEVVSQLTLCLLRQVEEVHWVRRGQEAGWKRVVALIGRAELLTGYHFYYLVGFLVDL